MSKLNNRGISLIEAIVTIAVILTGILVLVRVFPLAFQIGRSAEQATVAINLAQAQLENMFYLDYDNIGIGTVEAKQRLASDPANPFYYYQRETVIAYVDGNLNTAAYDTGLKKITVTTYWQSAFLKTEKSVQAILLISEK